MEPNIHNKGVHQIMLRPKYHNLMYSLRIYRCKIMRLVSMTLPSVIKVNKYIPASSS